MDKIVLFLDLHKQHSKGRWYLEFQQSWFNDYFDETCDSWKRERKLLWSKLITTADVKIEMADQRIIASALAYDVYDLMVEHVKQYKVDNDSSDTVGHNTESELFKYC